MATVSVPASERPSLIPTFPRRALALRNAANTLNKPAAAPAKPPLKHTLQPALARPIARAVNKLPATAVAKHVVSVVDKEREVTCSDYAADVLAYLLVKERQSNVAEGFLDARCVSAANRHKLIDYIAEMRRDFHLLAETLHLCVFIIDTYLAKHDVAKEELQMLGIVALVVASKYEETYPFDLKDAEEHLGLSIKEMTGWERKILSCLGFDLSRPTSAALLPLLARKHDIDEPTLRIAKYFAEVALLEYSIAHVSPSCVAAASLVLASHVTNGSVSANVLCGVVCVSGPDLSAVCSRIARSALDWQSSRAALTLTHVAKLRELL